MFAFHQSKTLQVAVHMYILKQIFIQKCRFHIKLKHQASMMHYKSSNQLDSSILATWEKFQSRSYQYLSVVRIPLTTRHALYFCTSISSSFTYSSCMLLEYYVYCFLFSITVTKFHLTKQVEKIPPTFTSVQHYLGIQRNLLLEETRATVQA